MWGPLLSACGHQPLALLAHPLHGQHSDRTERRSHIPTVTQPAAELGASHVTRCPLRAALGSRKEEAGEEEKVWVWVVRSRGHPASG